MEPSAYPTPTATAADGWFKTTHWSVVLAAGQESAQSHDSLARLCQLYWQPLYSYIRRSGCKPEDAQDLTQEFFARLVARDYLKSAAPEKGRFRSFLLMALKRFMANEWDRANRQKRGGGREIISLDAQDTENRYLCEPVDQLSPDKLFDRRWAKVLLERVMTLMEAEFASAGKGSVFTELKPFLSGDDEDLSYGLISQKLGLSEGTLRVTVHRFRQRYRELLREEVARTVEGPDAVDDELRCLFSAASGS
jgi:RNA polymerase sigma factor (sigma-70 family)